MTLGNALNIKKNKIRCKGKANHIELVGKLKNSNITIKGNNNHLRLKKGSALSDCFLEIIGDNCTIEVDECSIIGESYLSAKGQAIQLLIGKNCMFSREVELLTYDGHPIFDLQGQQLNIPQSIKIEDKVWLAAKVTVLKGVTIGQESVIGTGSIVTQSIPANTVAVGIPAKVKKEQVCWKY